LNSTMKRFAKLPLDNANEAGNFELPTPLPKCSALTGVFARAGTAVRLSRHQQLTLPADAADCAYLMQSGTIAVEAITPQRQIIDFGYAGELLEVSLLPAVPHLRLYAIEACELWRLRQKPHKPLFMELPDVLRDYQLLSTAMIKRLVLANIMLGSLTGEQRVASFLVLSVMRQGRVTSNRCTLRMPMMRADIADYLSLNPDTLSRITSDLQDQGLLATQGRHQMHILDWRALCDRTPLSAAMLQS
jgi:CRP/FNR family transcriptional regulator, anaerobic regulatory protein